MHHYHIQTDSVTLTEEMLELGKSLRGGWQRRQLALFGVKWPLKHGWKRSLIGRQFHPRTIKRFIHNVRPGAAEHLFPGIPLSQLV